jgi:Leucine Rich repeat
LASINLEDNGIGDTGSSSLAGALLDNTTLTQVFLNGNCIGPGGVAAIAEMVRVNTSLQLLGLGRNCIGRKKIHWQCWIWGDNAEISLGLQKSIDFVLASCRALQLFLKRLHGPLQTRLISLAIHAEERLAASDQKPALAQFHETVAGPIFHLVKTVVKALERRVSESGNLGAPPWILQATDKTAVLLLILC